MQAGRANAVVDDLVSLAMEEGLERCLLEIAKSHENKTGQWLDAIESDVVSSLKGSLAASAGVAPDAPPVETASAADGDVLQGVPRQPGEGVIRLPSARTRRLLPSANGSASAASHCWPSRVLLAAARRQVSINPHFAVGKY